MELNQDFIISLLKIMAKYDLHDEIYWTEDLEFSVLCSDVFYWGVADMEDLTPSTLSILEKSLKDANEDGALLYCARMRKMRPQGVMYELLKKENWKFFDECGPEREAGIGNPKNQKDVI